MPLDLKALGWSELFQPTNTVKLPEQLSKKWWDKKKSVVAKMTRATGIGAALDSLEDAFKKLAFPDFNPHPTKIKENVDDVKAFITSPGMKALQNALKEVRDLARNEAKELKKNLLTKNTAKVVDEIEQAAETLIVSTNTNSLTEGLKTAMVAWQKGQAERDIRMAPTTVSAAKKVLKTIDDTLPGIRDLLGGMVDDKDDATRDRLANPIRTLCRNMTQPLVNLLKVDSAGVGLSNFDRAKFEALSKQIVPISNSQGSEFITGLSKARVTVLVRKLESWCSEFKRLVEPVEIVKEPKV